MTSAALYDAVVTHTRRQQIRRGFAHNVYMWLVDIDALPRLPWFLRSFARFEARDHLGDPKRSIRENLDSWLASQGVDLRGGRVLMLANARVLGYVFNPLSVYWCHTPDGELECIVAEVHNTYGERHCYLLRPDQAGRVETDKEFYVSPFFTVEGRYRMRFSMPGEKVGITIALQQDGRTPFTATLRGVRRPAGNGAVLRTALRRPFMPQWVSTLIFRHGIALWLRRIPVVPRTPHVAQEGVQ
ncbi:DUF1365 domain-containing protein [Allokutzneria oryzae]|uniref:DUF1365 domain-containing protein n=1 Tax=Allokutzneria oryzae TaxID=1378989 RepID=A0ABV5ZTT4_9PSEU